LGTDTKIAWASHTLNPWIGCTPVHEGCENCYARAWNNRFAHHPPLPFHTVRLTAEAARLEQTLRRWSKAAALDGAPATVFVCSLSDFAIEPAPPEVEKVRQVLLELMPRFQSLRFLLLTKRPMELADIVGAAGWEHGFVPPNVGVGVSVSSERSAGLIDELVKIPAAFRFVSHGPMLGRVEIKHAVDWWIIEGESGPKARPLAFELVAEQVAECRERGIPAFVKQLGSRAISDEIVDTPLRLRDPKGGDPAEWPVELPRDVPDWLEG